MTRTPSFSRINITNDEINALPLHAFDGTVKVIQDRDDLPQVFKEISKHSIVGFDTETKPVFVKGQRHNVALMQIATPDQAFLIRVKFTGMTPEIITFLENDKVLKAGVGVRDDIKTLQVLKKFTPAGFVELADMARNAGLGVESVKKLTALLLGFRISKSAQTSNWEVERLDTKQISYAATDAWVCLNIYRKLTGDLA
ncbi:MAG TPA: 3'-5' exonuclease [Cyclobacteriaceae bacterium]|nr:3'-5' exonuclease [Cyclobacteriaceae bacterium]